MQVLLHLANRHGGASRMMMHLMLVVLFTTVLNRIQWLSLAEVFKSFPLRSTFQEVTGQAFC